MICWVGILSGGMGGEFSTRLGSKKRNEGEGRKNNVRNLFQDLYIKKSTSLPLLENSIILLSGSEQLSQFLGGIFS